MLRVEVSENGQPGLPAIDVDDATFVIGSAPTARIRLPIGAARPEHVRIDGARWRTAEASGEIGDGASFALGTFRVRVAPAPPDAIPTPPQRTESLARELMRSLLGAGAAPSLEIERGPRVGAKRMLAPPESMLVIGRGDEAGWVILDGDLSKAHAEIRRGWDGVRVIDLGSKNGTKVDGVAIRDRELRDGALVELGAVALRYRDPAEKHLSASPEPAPAPTIATRSGRSSPIAFYAALGIAMIAVACIIWIAARY